MKKIHFAAIGIFLAIFILIFLAYIPPVKDTSSSEKNISVKNPSAEFFFQNTTYNSTDVILLTNSPVSTAQIELVYNPQALYAVTIQPAENNFFGNPSDFSITLQEIRPEIGRISFAITQNAQHTQKTGEGKIATLTFQRSESFNLPTQLQFINKSTVLKRGSRESILTTMQNLTLPAKNTNTPTTQLNESPQN